MSPVTFEEPSEERCGGMLDVGLSNPERLLVTEGSNGVPRYYDSELLQRDL